MNVDLSIHRLGFRQARSIEVAYAQIAQLRQAFEIAVQSQPASPEQPNGARVAAALSRIEAQSAAVERITAHHAAGATDHTARHVDIEA